MNTYSLKARNYPMGFLLIPFVIIGIEYSIEMQAYLHILSTFGITTVLIYFASNISRDCGKKIEPNLWEKWGGMPSAKMLSFDDTTIDEVTKRRYHEKLKVLCPIDTIYNLENVKYEDVKNVYIAWSKYLSSQTRDNDKFHLLSYENTNYGFRRNLLGLKKIGITTNILIFVINSVVFIYLNKKEMINDSFILLIISELLILVIILLWIFMINKNWVKIPAIEFGKRLLESIDIIKD